MGSEESMPCRCNIGGGGMGAPKNTSSISLAILVHHLYFIHVFMSHAVYKSFKLILARVVRQKVWHNDVLTLIIVHACVQLS